MSTPLKGVMNDEDQRMALIAAAAVQAVLDRNKMLRKLGRNDVGRGSGTIGEATRQARIERGWSVSHAAEVCGIHPTFWGKIERGERGMSLSTFAKMARYLPEWWRDAIINEAARWD